METKVNGRGSFWNWLGMRGLEPSRSRSGALHYRSGNPKRLWNEIISNPGTKLKLLKRRLNPPSSGPKMPNSISTNPMYAITLLSDSGKPDRVPDLIDVWFDSGAMPYAQWVWHKKLDAGILILLITFDKSILRLYCWRVDQTRLFYTLHEYCDLFDSVAYKPGVKRTCAWQKRNRWVSGGKW